MFYKSDIIHRPLDAMSKVDLLQVLCPEIWSLLITRHTVGPIPPLTKLRVRPCTHRLITVAVATILISRYDTVHDCLYQRSCRARHQYLSLNIAFLLHDIVCVFAGEGWGVTPLAADLTKTTLAIKTARTTRRRTSDGGGSRRKMTVVSLLTCAYLY